MGQSAMCNSPVGCPPVIRKVLFDFDLTLTVLKGIEYHRLFPEQSDFDVGIDIDWIHEEVFGGYRRVAQLNRMLHGLYACGAELHVVSLNHTKVITRALSELGMLHYFWPYFCGWPQIVGRPMLSNARTSKRDFIRGVMQQERLCPCEVLFVDDQEENIRSMDGICLTHHVQGCGLSGAEMSGIVRQVVDGGADSQLACHA
eukprot:gnl/TRDRNA2_/TRDRNA2_47112_c0_seq1.p1 gnl/TRDRNA2_/TRDRNA2_47112_c0~~gnl/TRDRNA2_/TRDRNA2_47112_c0_seq1.p1  ORF type:complete len:220 (+),score=31.87 gnl/TRDRNA2_/TRDRNA2_47112_c0_seq1:60-662(+)